MIPNDGSRITKIVFLANDRRAAKLPRGKKAKKQWACPQCGRALGADSLLDFESGWTMETDGRWWTKGICPHCFSRVQFTKSGAAVIVGDHTPGREWKPVRKTIIRRRT